MLINVDLARLLQCLRACDIYRSWRQAIVADQAFLKGIRVSINAKAPLRGSQLLCECCRGLSLMVQQTRHRQIPVPRVLHKVCPPKDREEDLTECTTSHECLPCHCPVQPYVNLHICCHILGYIVQAAYSGNVSASVSLAQIDDARGDTTSALKYWAKAAKLGHPEGQFRLGRVSVCCWQYLTLAWQQSKQQLLLQRILQKRWACLKTAHFDLFGTLSQ